MKIQNFNECVRKTIEKSLLLLTSKGQEYAEDDEGDRLAHFKKAASFTGGTPITAAWGMLTKHLVSLSDMIIEGDPLLYPQQRWDEKLLDAINYLLIIRAIVQEAYDGQDRS